MRNVLLGFLLLYAAGCSESPPASSNAPAAPAPVSQHIVEVELTEGTNLSFAATSSQLVLALQGRLFTTAIGGGQAKALIATGFDAREPSIRRDGMHVAFHGYANGNWDLFSVSMAGGEPEALTDDGFDDREPDYANHSDAIVFSSDRSGSYDIWVRQADGTLTQLTDEAGDAHSPSWSPGDRYVAYAVGPRGAPYQLKQVSIETGEVTDVITENGVISGISWLPDAQQLSYQMLSRTAEGFARSALRQVTVEDGSAITLSREGSDVFPFRAHWVDNDTVLYAADGGVLKKQGDVTEAIPFSAVVQLDRTPYEKRGRDHDTRTPQRVLGISTPAISSTGETVLFAALGDIWSWKPATETLTPLSSGPAADQSPVFMPGDDDILYITDRSGRQELVQLNLSSGTEKVIEIAGANTLSFPALSPDGGRVSLFRDVPANPMVGQLIVVDLATGEVQPVGQPIPAQPSSWDAAGKQVLTTRLNAYSQRYREGVYELLWVDLQSGEESSTVPIAHKSTLNAALVPGANAVTYVQDGVLWRLELNELGQALEAPVRLTDDLTDQPAWSLNGEHLVYSRGDKLFHLTQSSGAVREVTPKLEYSSKRGDDTWTLRVGRIFDGLSDRYSEPTDILIDGNRIVGLEPVDVDRAGEVVDASDHTVIPGLFEMHAHMGTMSGAQGRIWLAYGVTSVRDPGSHPYVAKERQETWDAGVSVGPRTHITGFLADGNRVYYSVAEGITSDEHLERAIERTRLLQLDLVKTYVRLPDHWQARVVEAAHAMGIPVSSHELYPAVANGVDHVEHIGGTSRRGYQPKVTSLGKSYQDVVALLSESGMGLTATAVLPGFSVIVGNDTDYFETPQFAAFYGPQMAAGYRMLARRFGAADEYAANNGELLRALVANDALLVTGTDAPFVPYGAGLHAELRLYARAGLTPAQVLRAATIKSAQAAHVDADLGSVEVGKVADLVVLDGDPLASINDVDNVVMTIKGGQRFTLEQLSAER